MKEVSMSRSPQLARSSRHEFLPLKSLGKNSGFSLIEMIVVSSLLLLFSAVVMIGYSISSRVSRDGKREQDIKQVQVALEQYYEIHRAYPVANSMSSLLSNSNFTEFLQNSKIQDPLNTGVYIYTVSSNGTTYQLSYTRESDSVQVNVNTIGR